MKLLTQLCQALSEETALVKRKLAYKLDEPSLFISLVDPHALVVLLLKTSLHLAEDSILSFLVYLP